jgi:hypothetical protein
VYHALFACCGGDCAAALRGIVAGSLGPKRQPRAGIFLKCLIALSDLVLLAYNR